MKKLITDEKLAALIYIPPYRTSLGRIFSYYGADITEQIRLDEGETVEQAVKALNEQ